MSEEPEVFEGDVQETNTVGGEDPVTEEQSAAPESLQPDDLALETVEGMEEAVVEAEDEPTGEAEAEVEGPAAAAEEMEEVVAEAEEELTERAEAEVEEQASAAEEVEEAVVEAEDEPTGEVEAEVEGPASAAEEMEEVVAEAEEELTERAEVEAEEQASAAEKVETVVAEAEDEPAVQEGRYWYVIHSYSGYENKVRQNLGSRIETMGMEDYIFEVVVPTEEVVELRDGRRRTVEQRIFPGYILVDMILNDESWFVVRNTPGVTGFVGSGNEPTPLRQDEADNILRRMEEEAPKVKVSFRIGDAVRIIDGPFTDFLGTVDDLNLEKGKVRLLVSFFGRETPVELDFLQVETV
jgi:transcriptional antiterminator NusG